MRYCPHYQCVSRPAGPALDDYHAAYITVQSVVPIVVVISITGWAWEAQVLRSPMMTLKNRDYVKAAIIAGSPLRIIFCEIFPNMLGLIVANFFGAALYACGRSRP